MKIVLLLLSLSFLTPVYALAQGKYLYECEGCLDNSDFTRFAIGSGLNEVYLYNRETLDIRAFQIKEGRDPEVPLVLAFEIEPDTTYVHALRDVLQTVSVMASRAIPIEELDIVNKDFYDSGLKFVGSEARQQALSDALSRMLNQSGGIKKVYRETRNGNAVMQALGWNRGTDIVVKFPDESTVQLRFKESLTNMFSDEVTHLYEVIAIRDVGGNPLSDHPRDYRGLSFEGSERAVGAYHDLLWRVLFGGVGIIQVGCQVGSGQSTMRCAENADGVLKCVVVYVKPAC